MEPLLTPEEAAALLRISRWAVYRLVSEGRIPYVKLGGGRLLRFDRKRLERWILETSFDPNGRE